MAGNGLLHYNLQLRNLSLTENADISR